MNKILYVEFLKGKKHGGNLEDRDVSEFLDTFEDAGIEITDGLLVVDIDNVDRELIEKIREEFNINTHTVWTDRGAHLYFQKPDGWNKGSGSTPLGIKVEYKFKKDKSQHLTITVKRNGVAREITNEGKVEPLPDVLRSDKRYSTLYGLDEGDERNNKMFKHRRQLEHLENWDEVMSFVNENVLATPLDPEEIALITRDLPHTYSDMPEEVALAERIIREKKVVVYAGMLWYLNGGHYENDPKKVERLPVQYAPAEVTKFYKEVLAQLAVRAEIIPSDKEFPIKLKNGILRNGKFYPIEYNEFTPYVVDIAYNPDAAPVQIVEDYLDHISLGDPCYRKLLLEIMGYGCITDVGRIKSLARFFIAVGDGGNGKGTFLDIINAVFGEHNTSALDIDQMPDEKHLYSMVGKLFNLGDDLIDKPINKAKMKILKNVATADRVQVRQLYKTSESVRITATMVFSSNHEIKTFEKGHSIQRRITWLPIDKRVKDPDPDFLAKASSPEAKEYWLKLIVEGYQRLYKNKKFTTCEIVEEYNRKYHEDNDSTVEFVRDHVAKDFIGMTAPKVYDMYVSWVEENLTSQPLAAKQLKATLKRELNIVTKPKKVNGKTARLFVLVDDDGKEVPTEEQK